MGQLSPFTVSYLLFFRKPMQTTIFTLRLSYLESPSLTPPSLIFIYPDMLQLYSYLQDTQRIPAMPRFLSGKIHHQIGLTTLSCLMKINSLVYMQLLNVLLILSIISHRPNVYPHKKGGGGSQTMNNKIFFGATTVCGPFPSFWMCTLPCSTWVVTRKNKDHWMLLSAFILPDKNEWRDTLDGWCYGQSAVTWLSEYFLL